MVSKALERSKKTLRQIFSLIHRVQYVSSEFSYCMSGRVVWSESILTVIQYIMSTQKNIFDILDDNDIGR